MYVYSVIFQILSTYQWPHCNSCTYAHGARFVMYSLYIYIYIYILYIYIMYIYVCVFVYLYINIYIYIYIYI